MRNPWYLFFWTELGRRITGGAEPLPDGLPFEMATVLRSKPPSRGGGRILIGSRMSSRSARYIYAHTWNGLRELGFSRPLRLRPWPGITLLVPFYRGSSGVLPQSFSERVPRRERALSLVGRSAAARRSGTLLWAVLADWDDEVLRILENGGVSACSLDMLGAAFEKA